MDTPSKTPVLPALPARYQVSWDTLAPPRDLPSASFGRRSGTVTAATWGRASRLLDHRPPGLVPLGTSTFRFPSAPGIGETDLQLATPLAPRTGPREDMFSLESIARAERARGASVPNMPNLVRWAVAAPPPPQPLTGTADYIASMERPVWGLSPRGLSLTR